MQSKLEWVVKFHLVFKNIHILFVLVNFENYHKKYEVRKPAEDESPHNDSELCCRLLFLCQHIRSVPPIPSPLSLRASAEEVAQKWLHAVCTGITRFCLLYLAGLAELVIYAIITPGPSSG